MAQRVGGPGKRWILWPWMVRESFTTSGSSREKDGIYNEGARRNQVRIAMNMISDNVSVWKRQLNTVS